MYSFQRLFSALSILCLLQPEKEDYCHQAVTDSGGARGNIYSPRAVTENASDCMHVHREKGKENEKGKGQQKEISIELSMSSNCGNMKLDNTMFCRLT